jgi:IclR helix-turn-helix domain
MQATTAADEGAESGAGRMPPTAGWAFTDREPSGGHAGAPVPRPGVTPPPPPLDPTERIAIELSPSQVDRVDRGASERGGISVLLSGLKDVREVLEHEPRQLEDGRLSRSLLAGLLMLACFPSDGSYLANAEIARMLEMNPSTTHRYVATLVAIGLLERDPATRRYRLA